MAQTPAEFQAAYLRMTGGQMTLSDAQAAALAAQAAGDPTFFETWTFQVATSTEVQHSTGAVAKIWQSVMGNVPTSQAELDQQVATMNNEVDAAIARLQAAGVDPAIIATASITIAYKAMGASLANSPAAEADGFLALEFGQNTDTVIGQRAFVAKALEYVFGAPPSEAQITANVAVFETVKAYYAATPVPEWVVDARAKGEFLADLMKQAQDLAPPALNTNVWVMAEINFIQQLGNDDANFGESLLDQPGLGGEDFFLTPGTDLGLVAGQPFFGTDGDDTYWGDVEGTALFPLQTLNNTDAFNGREGWNVLNAQLVNDVTPAALLNIQEINLSGAPGFITPAVTLDLVNADAVDVMNFNALNNDISVSNLTRALSTVGFRDSQNFDQVDIGFIGGLDGIADVLQINMQNADIDFDLDFDGVGPDQGYEEINIASNGPAPNFLELRGTAATPHTVRVTGTTAFDIVGEGLSLDHLRLFDASGLNAPLFAEFDGNAGVNTVVELFGAQGDTDFEIDFTTADLFIQTFGGNDDVDVWTHTGNLTVDVGAGENHVELEVVAGAVGVLAGDGPNILEFLDITGDVTVIAGDGGNQVFFEDIDGIITVNT
ncbi:MAG: hypothetical protein AB7V46_20305, partial [Thermomicrobiales bacterium]